MLLPSKRYKTLPTKPAKVQNKITGFIYWISDSLQTMTERCKLRGEHWFPRVKYSPVLILQKVNWEKGTFLYFYWACLIVSKNIGGLPDKLCGLFITHVLSAILCTLLAYMDLVVAWKWCILLGGLKGCAFSNDILIHRLWPVVSIVFKVSMQSTYSDLWPLTFTRYFPPDNCCLLSIFLFWNHSLRNPPVWKFQSLSITEIFSSPFLAWIPANHLHHIYTPECIELQPCANSFVSLSLFFL